MELLFPLILLLPLVLLFMRQRRQQRAFVEQQQRVAPGMTIMTTAGLFATVVEIDGDVMVLDPGDGSRLRWNRLAVGRIVEPTADDGDAETAAAEASGATVDVRKPDTSAADATGSLTDRRPGPDRV